MSLIQLLVMDAERRPELACIQQAASNEAIPYQAYEADLASHTGFLPITVGGRKTGFEYYFAPIDGQLPAGAMQFGSHQMMTRTGGNMMEMMASLMFLRTAAKLSNAAYVYPDDGIIIRPDQVDAFLSEQIDQIRKFV